MENLVNQSPLSSQTNLVFIDSNIEESQGLLDNIQANAEVVILNEDKDGISQVTEALNNYDEVASIQIVSHGDRGSLQLGSTQLNSANLNQYQDQLMDWGKVLPEDGDILIFGCNVAGGEGANFVEALSEITGADIAASIDLTGNRALGGDGDLEYATGRIESEQAISSDAIAGLDITLVNEYVVQTDPNFQKETVLSGLNEPIDIAFLPDGDMLFLEKGGRIKIVDPNASNPTPANYLDISSRIQGGAEAGLLSIELDPDFASNNHFYIYYSDKNGSEDSEYRITRFTHDEATNTADLNSEFIVYRKPGPVRGHHDGGGLSFGPDGKIYLTLGDHEPSRTADPTWNPDQIQDLSFPYGKVLRINKDGTIPSDNPYVDGPGGNLDEIWAVGLRNPYRANWDNQSGRFFIGDVGGNVQSTAQEEVNLGQAGANYGWPDVEGVTGNPSLTDPIFDYDHTGSTPNGGAITAGIAYRGNQFPAEYDGSFFFGDFVLGWIKYLQFDAAGNVVDADTSTPEIDAFNFDDSASTVVAIEQAPDGSIYYAELAENFSGPGSIRRITYNTDNQLPIIESASSDITEGAVGDTINFTTVATDGNDDPLTYTWSFGDGTTATGTEVSHTYGASGAYTATVQVSDGTGTVNSDPITVQIGSPPVIDVNSIIPVDGSSFRAGDTISISGSATDSDSTLDESNYSWDIDFAHNAHTHPEDDISGQSSFDFTIPTSGHGYADNTAYNFELTVTDSDGLRDVETVTIVPEKVDVTIESNVPGDITYTFDGGAPRTGSFVYDEAINFQRTIGVQDEIIVVDGVEYTFESWSNGIDTPITTPSFVLTVPDENQTYTANYVVTDTGVSANAVNDNFVVEEDAVAVPLDVLANDNASGGLLTITAVGTSSNGGVVAINDSNDGLLYTPVSGFTGVETFNYTIAGSDGDTSQATVSVAIGGTNNAPNAVVDSFSVSVDSANNSLDVLANDTDPDIGTNASATLDFTDYEVLEASTANPGRATIIRHPALGEGLDGVDLIFDASAAAGNEPHFHMMGLPAAQRPNFLTQHNSGGNGQQINFNMSREDGQAFSFEGFSYTSGLFFPGSNAGFTVIGTTADGSEISQTFGAANTETAFQAVTLDEPRWQNVTSVQFVGDVIGSGTEISQELNLDRLLVSTASDELNITSVSSPSDGGSVTINTSNDGLIYTPNPGFEGTETLSYTIADLAGETSTATISIDVGEGTPNNSDLPVTDGLVLQLDANEGVTTDGTDLVTGWSDQSGSSNDLTGAGDPRIVSGALNGQDAIHFDGAGDKLERTLALNNLPGGNAERTVFMVARYNGNNGGAGGFVYGNPSNNNAFGLMVDNEGELGVQGWSRRNDLRTNEVGVGSGWLSQSTVLENDQVTLYRDGVAIGSKNQVFDTNLNRIMVGAELDNDPYLDVDIATVLVFDRALLEAERQQVDDYLQQQYFSGSNGEENNPPVAGDDSFDIEADSSANDLDVLTNDTDLDAGDVLTIMEVDTTGIDPNSSLSINTTNDGLVYTPSPGLEGAESFTYTISDGNGGTDTATVTANVSATTGGNTPPVAIADSFDIEVDSSDNALDVLTNDSDDDAGDVLTITEVDTTGIDPNSSLSINTTNDGLVYTPAPGLEGAESFTYTISDGNDGTDTATVTANVGAGNSGSLPSGLVLQLDANEGVTTDGTDLVTGWSDQSGSSNDLTGAGDPRIVSGALNGQDAIHFDGAGDKLERTLALNNLPGGNAERTVFMVARYNGNNGGAGGFVYGNPSNNNAFGLMVDNEGELGVQGWSRRNDLRTNEVGVGSGWLSQSTVLENDQVTLYRDGVAIGSKNQVFDTNLNRIMVGAELDNEPYLDVDIATVLVFDRALSEAERQQVDDYLQQQYFSGS